MQLVFVVGEIHFEYFTLYAINESSACTNIYPQLFQSIDFSDRMNMKRYLGIQFVLLERVTHCHMFNYVNLNMRLLGYF